MAMSPVVQDEGENATIPAERNWFLFKERDECATTDEDVTVSLPARGARCSRSAE
jgi:hypothetical protein